MISDFIKFVLNLLLNKINKIKYQLIINNVNYNYFLILPISNKLNLYNSNIHFIQIYYNSYG